MILATGRRHLRRYREIAGVLARHGWGWMLERAGIYGHSAHHPGAHAPGEHLAPGPTHLREVLEELGPTFIKFGQLLSTRPDVVPEPYIVELAKLQDTAPTLPAIGDSFGNRVRVRRFGKGRFFPAFDDVPIAAASLAQVHKAQLPDGAMVIVKIQRPHVGELVETDIEILYKRAKFLEGHWEKARTYGVTDIVDEFATTIREELDYTREARNTERLHDMLSSDTRVKVPKVYWEMTTHKVLTLEMMRGVKITEVPTNPMLAISAKDIAGALAAAFLEQVFVNGFFHADPHPGNILVNDRAEIELVDCGQVGRLDSESRAGAVRLLLAFEEQDPRGLADEILNLGIAQEDVDLRLFTKDLSKVLRYAYDMPARSMNMGWLLTRVLEVSADHKIRLPVVFAVLGKVFSNIDGICRRLDPNFNFTEAARAYVGKAVRKEISTESTLNELYRAISGTRSFLLALPEQLERLMRKTVEGTLRIEFKHMGLDEASRTFRNSANRISMALIVGSIIVGSSLIVSAGKGTRFFGLPTLGLIGYVLATLFGIWIMAGNRPVGEEEVRRILNFEFVNFE